MALLFHLVRLGLIPALQGAPCFLVSLPRVLGSLPGPAEPRALGTGPGIARSCHGPSHSPRVTKPFLQPTRIFIFKPERMMAATELALTRQGLLSSHPHNSSLRRCRHPILQRRKPRPRAAGCLTEGSRQSSDPGSLSDSKCHVLREARPVSEVMSSLPSSHQTPAPSCCPEPTGCVAGSQAALVRIQLCLPFPGC